MKLKTIKYGVVPLTLFGALLIAAQLAQAQNVTVDTTGGSAGTCTLTITPPPDKIAGSVVCDGCFGAGDGGTVLFGGTYTAGAFAQQDATALNVIGNTCATTVSQVTVDYFAPGAIRPPGYCAVSGCGNPYGFECLSPGCQLVIGAYTFEMSDGGKASVYLSNQVCVEAPFKVVFMPGKPIVDDNIADNTNATTGQDADTSSQAVNRFAVSTVLEHHIQLFDCYGNDVTATYAPLVTVYIDIKEYNGTYASATMINDIVENYVGTGDPGSIMEFKGNHFQYNLKSDKTNYDSGTVNNTKYFRSVVSVVYNDQPGVIVGREDAIFESK